MSFTEKLREALKDRARSSAVSSSTATNVLTANGIESDKSNRKELVDELIDNLNYFSYLPQPLALTSSFMREVIDPETAVAIPTGVYRLTMRKLLRLSRGQLEKQADLMKLNIEDLDETGIAVKIIQNINERTELIPELGHMLLSKEVAYIFGIKFRIYRVGMSSFVDVVVSAQDMVQSSVLDRNQIRDECVNQGVPVDAGKQESKLQLSVRLISWLTTYPQNFREPMTKGFSNYIRQLAVKVSR